MYNNPTNSMSLGKRLSTQGDVLFRVNKYILEFVENSGMETARQGPEELARRGPLKCPCTTVAADCITATGCSNVWQQSGGFLNVKSVLNFKSFFKRALFL